MYQLHNSVSVAYMGKDGMVERWRETEEEAVEQWNRRISDEEDAKC